MPARDTTAAAARAAVLAAANASKSLESALRGVAGVGSDPGVKTDGRKARWRQHKEDRRTELVDGTLTAVRELGSDVGMDEIATHIGVSKTVLYRYFSDKNDLSTAAMVRFIETILLPRLSEALHDDVDEFTVTRAVIAAYVQTISENPQVYAFVTSSQFASPAVLADSEKLIATVVAYAMNERLRERDLDTSGFETWSYALVGGVQLATHWWMVEQRITQESLIDHLTMLVWTSFVGIAQVGGSVAEFNRQDHPLPEIATPAGAAPPAARVADMSEDASTPSDPHACDPDASSPDACDPDAGAGEYVGPATVTVTGRRPVQVPVQLVGHFDPIAGRYTWQGRIRGLADVADPTDSPVTEGTAVRIQTPHGAGDATMSAQDAFGGHVVRGVGAPPFAQLPDDTER
ncbi:DUF4873 domain-containing protein [Williamsia sp. CHRR-6]|uniref:DUF4873 domain-containing protein n=1 Tax=Williamsia sp. CHRR-6 TaxID=2835871 RepID=UPI001BDAB076|nr:DUF4873 domain-containing protein [Williamsia sp. CHRR-6]MBT0566948.1 DUF4873 domain-containing protein [Williamsia sp. CHRR-6]